jgi:dUTP pyrophosphatase
MSLILKIKKLSPDVTLPTYAHAGDAAFDLLASTDITVAPMQRVQVPTGIALEIPDGYVGFVWDKSGLSHKQGIKTLGGVIDAGYRGEVMVGVINLGSESYTFAKGNKVAQMVIQKRELVTIEEVTELSDTTRGQGGFGSTGK